MAHCEGCAPLQCACSCAALTGHPLTAVASVAMGAFAFALPYLNWLQAAGLALTALIVNLVLLPRLARQLFRAGELEHRLVGGIVFYPLSVLMLVVTFPTRPDIVAMSWGVLAAGDGLATLAGQAVGGPRLPWNRDKTWAGTIVFVVAAAVGLGMIGYDNGIARRRFLLLSSAFAVVLAAALWMTIDLDGPRHGFVRASEQPYADLLASMKP